MNFSAISAGGGTCFAISLAWIKLRDNIYHIMRISLITSVVLFSTIPLLFASTDTKGQTISSVMVEVSLYNEDIFSAIQQIEQQTEFKFVYGKSELTDLRLLKLNAKKQSVSQVLSILLDSRKYLFRQINKNIIISLKAPADKITKFSGIVVDDGNSPIPGVTIRSKTNNNISTATDFNGHFSISGVNKGDILIFSYIGYLSKEVILSDSTFRVVMKRETNSLDEVVVIGYGSSTRKELTGSVATIDAKTISKQPVGNVLNAMQGQMAGVQVTQTNGLPGSGINITIRGRNTLNAGALPLYIVDGVPFTFFNSEAFPATDDLNAFGVRGANGGVSPLNSLNPSDIESITILKDADATAIYGARAANGVVLITTKKGRAGKTALNVNVSSGFGKVGHFIDMLSGEQYLELRREAFANDQVIPTDTDAPDLNIWSQNQFTDWQKELIGGTAGYTDAQATLSGGSELTHFSFSTGFHKETTVYKNDFGQKRLTGRLNVDHTSEDKKFYALFSSTYSYDNTDLPSIDLASSYNLSPNYPAYKPDGSLNYFPGIDNPYAYFLQKYDGKTTNFNAAAQLRYTILKGLDLKANLGYTTIGIDQVLRLPAASKNNSQTAQVSTAEFADNTSESYIIEPQVEYNTSLGKARINVLLGTTFQENTSKGARNVGTGYSNDNLLGTLAAAGTVSSSDSYDSYRFSSIFGRINYNWDSRYVINGTIRRDGSSRFGSNNRFGTFGALGAAYIFSNEAFIQNSLGFLSNGKIRGSYGLTGNDQISNYRYLSTYASGRTSQAYQGIPIQFPSRLANPDIQWERTKKFEAALDLGFFKDRLTLTTAFYNNISDNQLLFVPLGSQVGFTDFLGNFPAKIQNRGIEIELSSLNINKAQFSWRTSFNITFAKTKLLEFRDLESSDFYNGQFIIGESPNLTKLYVVNGIDPQTGRILYQTQSQDGLPLYNTDQIAGAQGNPYFGGITNSFTFKQFELGFLFQFSHQNGFTNNVTNALGSLVNQNASTLNRWRTANDQSRFPAASANYSSDVFNSYGFYYNSSTAFYGNASWLKLRNANLAYNLPVEICQKMKLKNLRLYAQGQNLWVLAKNKYVLDPETGNSLPALRTIVFGLNATF